MHERAKKWEKNEHSVVMERKGRKHVVALEADARVVVKVPSSFGGELIHFVELRGFQPASVIEIYQNASIVVDLYLNGLERATLEGILFGAYPIIIAADNGLDGTDFNLPHFARVNPNNEKSLADSITVSKCERHHSHI